MFFPHYKVILRKDGHINITILNQQICPGFLVYSRSIKPLMTHNPWYKATPQTHYNSKGNRCSITTIHCCYGTSITFTIIMGLNGCYGTSITFTIIMGLNGCYGTSITFTIIMGLNCCYGTSITFTIIRINILNMLTLTFQYSDT
jgi:hypothetical protein